jgi:hypothetical protein
MRAMAARVLTAGSGLLFTGARCAGTTCTFTVDFTGFSRLRTSTAPSRANAARTAPAGSASGARRAPGLAHRSDRVVTAAEE